MVHLSKIVWDFPFSIPSRFCVGFSIFDSISFLLNFIFLFNNYIFMDSFTLKRHNSFQNKNNRKATHSFAPRSLKFQW